MAKSINIELTAYEALEFLKWKSKIIDAVNAPFNHSLKITHTLNRIDNQIQVQLLSNATVGNFKGSHVEELMNIIKHG